MPPTRPIATLIQDDANLPRANGIRRIQEFHLDRNNDMLTLSLERALEAMLEAGGIIRAGTVSQSGNTVTVQDRMGISADGKTPVYIDDASIDFAGSPDGYYLLYIQPNLIRVPDVYTDQATQEVISHLMAVEIGQLGLGAGSSDYP